MNIWADSPSPPRVALAPAKASAKKSEDGLTLSFSDDFRVYHLRRKSSKETSEGRQSRGETERQEKKASI